MNGCRTFDKIIRKPSQNNGTTWSQVDSQKYGPKKIQEGSKEKGTKGVMLSNRFAAIDRGETQEEFMKDGSIRPPPTFLDYLENALASNDKGKAKVGEYGGSSPDGGASSNPFP
jgi:hypothetical protein